MMKKSIWFLAVLLFAGCSAPGNTEKDSSAAENASIESSSMGSSTMESSSMEESSAAASSASAEASSEASGTENGGQKEQPGSSTVSLYVPVALKEDEGSSLYKEVIGVADQFVEATAPHSEEGLFTLSYTGHYLENENGSMQAYFIGVNRIGEAIKNLSFTLNFLVDGEPVWDNVRFTLSEEEFGEQPNDTAMPIFLDIPSGKEDLLMNAEPDQTLIEIKNLELE